MLLSLDEHVILPVNKFCLMLCKILNRDWLTMFGFGSYHYERRCFICMIGLFVCVAFIWMEWDFSQWNGTSIQKSVNYDSVNLLLSLKTPDGSPTVLLPPKSLQMYIGG